MDQYLRLEIGALLILTFISINYFSAKRRNTIAHMVFSSLLGMSIINIISELGFAYLVIRLEYVSDWLNKFYMVSLGAIAAMIFSYLMASSYKEDEIDTKVLVLWQVLWIVSALVIIVAPIHNIRIKNWHVASGIGMYALYTEVAIYTIAILFALVITWKRTSRKVKYMIYISVIFMIIDLLLQTFNDYVSITSFGITVICVAIYLINENPDKLIIESLKYEKERADAANKSKSSFIAHVSHEIRTPINAILGMNEMIMRESQEEAICQYAQDISGAAYTLYGIINDVLDMSKMDSGKMDIVPVNYELNQLIYDTIVLNQDRIEEKQLDFFVEVDPTIPKGYYGDDIRLKQVLGNLLSNAVKYTHEGFIRLVVSGDFHGDYMDLKFQIRDTGIGIKEEDMDKLFVAFERIEESRNRNIEGTGLGMHISNNLLKMMGSKLKINSVYGEGSIFSFVITQRIVNPEAIGDFNAFTREKKESTRAGFKAPSVKVLVVDDNTLNRRVFASLLNNTEMRIDEASSGIKCLELVKKEQYDIIFLDHQMPEMDGVETLANMKKDKGHLNRRTPVIMLTANVSSELQDIYRKAGFDAYLTKPIFLNELEKIIKAYLPSYKIVVQKEVNEEKEDEGRWEDNLPAIRGIDWTEAIKHLPTKDVLYATLKEFHKSIDKEVGIMDDCVANIYDKDRMDMLRIKTHALKSSAAMIGAEMLSEGAMEVEKCAKEGDVKAVLEKYPYMINYYKTFKERLAIFNNGDEEKRTVIDYPQVLALTEMVRLEMMDMNKSNAIDALNELSVYKYPDDVENNILRLRNAVDDFDSEAVDNLVDEILLQFRILRDPNNN